MQPEIIKVKVNIFDPNLLVLSLQICWWNYNIFSFVFLLETCLWWWWNFQRTFWVLTSEILNILWNEPYWLTSDLFYNSILYILLKLTFGVKLLENRKKNSDFAVRSVHCVGSWQDKKLVINNKYLDKFWTAIHIDTILYTTYIRHALIRWRTGKVGWVERVTVKCGHIDNYLVMITLMILIISAEWS